MAFHTAEYDLYVLLGDPAIQPLWCWNKWQFLMPELDALLRVTRGPASIRSTQRLPDGKKGVKFGRIVWKNDDQQKWTHASPRTLDSFASWTFQDTELWAPTWTRCEKEKLAPDVFMAIASNNIYRHSAAFEPVIVIAIIRELACREDQLVARVVDRLRELVNPKLVAHMRRPWGRSTPSGLGFFDSVQELHVTGLFRLEPLQSLPVNLDLFKEKWDLVP